MVTLFDGVTGGGEDPPGPAASATGETASSPQLDTSPATSVRVRLTVAYDGSGFRGFWPNAGVRTVGGTLGAAIERVRGHRVEMACAGRTDAGVHAQGQVVSFDTPSDDLDPDVLLRAVNALCGPEIVVRHAETVDAAFDARHSASARCYRYTVLNRSVPDPFLAATTWHVPTPLDLRAMWLAQDPIIGEHDFSSFCRRPRGRAEASLRRRVLAASWHDMGDDLLRFDIEANAFCHQMVRSIVGTLVDVGLGRLRAGDIAGIIRGRDRSAAGNLAPPHGLTLWRVRYD